MATILGTSTSDTLTGTSSADSIYGQAGDDTLIGGLANDTLQGGFGNDTYIFNRGDGQDTIFDNGAGSGEINTLQFGTGIATAQVIVKEFGTGDLVLSITGTTDKITLRNQLVSAAGGVDQVVFADGTVWSRATLLALATAPTSGNDTFYGDYNANTLNGGAGNDTLSGGAGDDTLIGGTGNDTLSGGTGNDTYVFNIGDGQDTITDNGAASGETNTLQLGSGILPANVVVTEANGGADLVLTISGTTDKVTLKNQLVSATGGVDQVVFADGTVWTRAALLAQATAPTGGNDTFYGDYLANTLNGGAGNDTLYGAGGDDVLAGGTGNDVLVGGTGNDTYLFNLGDGQDTIFDNGSSNSSEVNTLRLGTGIAVGAVTVTEVNGGRDLLLSVGGTTDSVLLQNQLIAKSGGVDQIVFADGTVWSRADLLAQATLPTVAGATLYGDYAGNVLTGAAGNDVIYGAGGDDTLAGGGANDTLEGGVGNDTYLFGRGGGTDRINDNGAAADVDRLQFAADIVPTDIVVTQANGGQDIVLSIAGSSDSVVLGNQLVGTTGGVDLVQFADGTVWDRAAILLKSLVPTSGDDVLGGDDGANILTGGAGTDRLIGRGGADTYVYTLGDGADIIDDQASSDGDTVLLHGIVPSQVHVVRSGDNALLLFEADLNSRLTLTGQFAGTGTIEQIVFDDGTVWSSADLLAAAISGTDTVTLGTNAAETIVGSGANDTIEGLRGNDVLQGGGGDDTYIFNAGDGQDTIIESGGNDTLTFGRGLAAGDAILQGVGSDLYVRFRNSTDSVLIQSAFTGSSAAVETVRFADGTSWDLTKPLTFTYIGTDANTVLTGSSYGTNIFELGPGGDTVTAGSANDVVVVKRGIGHANVTLTGTGATLKLAAGIAQSEVTVQTAVNGDVTVALAGTDDRVTFLGAAAKGLSTISFSDGAAWRLIYGTSGNDTLNGGSGVDIINAGIGADQLNGGAGSDTFFYKGGDGNDTITEGGAADGSVDRLVLIDILPPRVSVTRSGTDVTLVIAPSTAGGSDGGSVLLKAELDTLNGQGVETIVFADGTVWSPAVLRAMLVTIVGTAGNDTLTGTSGSDIIAAGLGDDNIDGGGGSDSYIYNAGDGNDRITDSSAFDGAVDRLALGAGLAPENLLISRSGSDIIISFTNQPGSVRLVSEDGGAGTGVEQVVFADGTVWSKQQLESAYIAQQMAAGATTITGFDQNGDVIGGTAGNDTLYGLGGNDTLTGNRGDDTLDGGSGSDSYVYNAGDGNDVITDGTAFDSSNDRLVLGAGLTAANLVISRSGSDITLSFSDQAGSIRMVAFDSGSSVGLEQVVLGDGTVWSKQQLESVYIARQMAAGATTITGFDQNSDVIGGTAGNDTLYGLGGNDTLTGNGGNDALDGGGGSDTYVYNAGDGNDVITDGTAFDGSNDRLVLGTGLTAANLVISRSGSDVTLSFSDQPGSVRMVAFDSGSSVGLEQVVLGDGTVWSKQQLESAYIAQQMAAGATTITGFDQNSDVIGGTSGNDTLYGLGGNDTLTGNGGNDTLDGGGGSDTYVYNAGDGNDVITDGTAFDGSNDRLVLGTGLTAANLVISRSGSDVTLSFSDQPGSVRMVAFDSGSSVGLEQVVLGDGTVWSKQQLESAYIAQQMAAGATTITGFDQNNDVIVGTSGNDTLYGLGGNDTLNGGAGNDYLNGGSGSDTYIYNSAGGNNVIEDNTSDNLLVIQDIASTAVILSRPGNGADLVIENTLTGNTVTVKGQFSGGNLASVSFSDGVTWTAQNVASIVTNQPVILGTDAADTINGTANAEIIDGRGGNDLLNGAGGADTYLFRVGSGNDVIQEAATNTGNDVVKLLGLNQADVDITRSGNDLLVRILSSGETLTIKDQFQAAGPVVELLQFGASGTAIDLRNMTAPTVTITSPAVSSNVATQTIAGTVTSGGIAKVAGQTLTLTDNGVSLGTTTVQADGTFSLTVTLPNQGANALVVSVTDSFGNTGASAAVVDTLDTIAPSVAINGLAETSNIASQTVTGTVGLSGAAAVIGQTVTVTDNGAVLGTTTVQADGTFALTVTLPNQGANALVASVADSYGNVGTSAEAVVVLDSVAPTVAITSSAQAGNVAAKTVTGTVSLGGVANVVGQTVTVTDNGTVLGTTTVQPNGTFALTVTLPYQGANALVASVADAFGNVGHSAAVVDTLDNVAPTVTITGVGSTGYGAAQTITGTVSLDGAGTVVGRTVTLTDNGMTLATTAVQSDGTFSFNVTLPSRAINNLVASVSDSYGNAGASAAIVDTPGGVAPIITGTIAGQTTTSETPVHPFAGVTITDLNLGATDTLTITLSGAGGTLSGAGLSGSGSTYTLSGSATTITSQLRALTFTPAAGQANSSQTTTFTLADRSSGYTTAVYAGAPTVLTSFNGTTNGNRPFSALISDAAGNLYGTTQNGGSANGGVVFEIAKTSSGYSSTPIVLASFGGISGDNLRGGLVMDAAGNLFGTARSGGANGYGAVYEIVKTSTGYSSTPVVLASFSGTDGSAPQDALIIDAAGNLFGTTTTGGAGGYGTVYEIPKTASGYGSTPTVLVSFNGTNGANPMASLYMDASGNLFGTTTNGGANNLGTVYEIAKTVSGYGSTPTVLVSFSGTNGSNPYFGSLIADAEGNLFGTTEAGGPNDAGSIFEIVKTADGYGSAPIMLASFNGTNGLNPYGGLIMDAAGNLFGTTLNGGTNNQGTIFELTKTATGYSSTPTVLTSFNGNNGKGPGASLFMDAGGSLYGTTYLGGTGGVVFKLPVTSSTPAAPVVNSITTVTNIDPPNPTSLAMTSSMLESPSASQTSALDWFSSNSIPLQEITAPGLKIDSQIAQLVQAMASHSSSHAGFDLTGATNQAAPNDPTLQASIATAWHV
ncbi:MULTISPECIES: calcium-binding protein [unclassified Bradyrhizobium]|uniref:calcium-binding protein n=1 Tax=unclassified Bradyrhizobium TaxID=2631580 RepID=UPI0028E8791A|nr:MULTISPECIES: calcium-binding protein [unclassified Bradyrhizobium]